MALVIAGHCESLSTSSGMEGPSKKSLLSLLLLECINCFINIPEAENLHVEQASPTR